jgi:hypothetical protein
MSWKKFQEDCAKKKKMFSRRERLSGDTLHIAQTACSLGVTQFTGTLISDNPSFNIGNHCCSFRSGD